MLKVGNLSIEARYTPGHTNACTSYLVGNMIFTGDALLIDGRVELTSSKVGGHTYDIHKQLFSLPDETIVYPGHDYKGRLSSTIGYERLNNSSRSESLA